MITIAMQEKRLKNEVQTMVARGKSQGGGHLHYPHPTGRSLALNILTHLADCATEWRDCIGQFFLNNNDVHFKIHFKILTFPCDFLIRLRAERCSTSGAQFGAGPTSEHSVVDRVSRWKRRIMFPNPSGFFSDEEWRFLQDWQKQLLFNVMKEINQALVSLGPFFASVCERRSTDNGFTGRPGTSHSPGTAVPSNNDSSFHSGTGVVGGSVNPPIADIDSPANKEPENSAQSDATPCVSLENSQNSPSLFIIGAKHFSTSGRQRNKRYENKKIHRVESGKTGCFSPKVTRKEMVCRSPRLKFRLGKSSRENLADGYPSTSKSENIGWRLANQQDIEQRVELSKANATLSPVKAAKWGKHSAI